MQNYPVGKVKGKFNILKSCVVKGLIVFLFSSDESEDDREVIPDSGIVSANSDRD